MVLPPDHLNLAACIKSAALDTFSDAALNESGQIRVT